MHDAKISTWHGDSIAHKQHTMNKVLNSFDAIVQNCLPNSLVCLTIGRIRLGNFVEHFGSVEHISYSTGPTSRNSVEHNNVRRNACDIFRS